MKKIYFTVCGFIVASSLFAQGISTPVASTAQQVSQGFGLGKVELSYSRPNVKSRTIFGDLVPYNAVWRTGANQATVLTFTDEVIIGSTKIAPGKYGLLSIPGKKEWILIISKQTNVNSPALYNETSDVVRVTVPVKKIKKKVESFTIDFSNIEAETADLNISWAKTQVTLPIRTNIDEKVMQQIEANMKTDKPAYYQAAQYYAENGKDLNKALEWFQKAAALQPDAFWIQYQLASCLAKLGQKEAAISAAEKSTELAKKAENNDYVKLNEKLIKQLKK